MSFMLFACSDDNDDGRDTGKNDHVWKEQTEAIDKAKEVEGMLLNSAEQTRKSSEH